MEKHRNLDPGIKGSSPFFPVEFVVVLTAVLVIQVENRSR